MKFFLKLLFILSILLHLTFNQIYGLEKNTFENSDPYLSLSSNKIKLKEDEQVIFTITYGNRGPEAAENVRIILNQPLDGRSPLRFISSDPQPDKWIISEYGNLAEFFIKKVETFETSNEGKIIIKAAVRSSVPPQTITPSSSLQAPNREMGKRLLTSESLIIQIAAETIESIATDAGSSQMTENQKADLMDEEDGLPLSITATDESQQLASNERASPESPWIITAFILISLLLIVAFIAGRKSKTST